MSKINYFISKKDFYFNCNKDDIFNKYRILFITGMQASGKTTLSLNLKNKYKCHLFSWDILDKVLSETNVYTDIEEFDEIIYNFLDSSFYKSFNEKKLNVDEYNRRLILQKAVLLFCENQKENIIIEGIFINELFDKKYLKYPFIIKGTSFIKSILRLIYRIIYTFMYDKKIINPNSFYNYIQFKDINDLIKKISNYYEENYIQCK